MVLEIHVAIIDIFAFVKSRTHLTCAARYENDADFIEVHVEFHARKKQILALTTPSNPYHEN